MSPMAGRGLNPKISKINQNTFEGNALNSYGKLQNRDFFFQMYTKKIIFEGFLNLLCWVNSFGWPTLADNTGGITIESNIGFHCRKMSRKSYYTIGSTAVTLSLVSSGTVFAGKTTHLLMDHPNTSKTYEKLLLPWSKNLLFYLHQRG